MLNIIPFGAAVLEKNIFLSISLYIESPCPKDAPCQISMHSGQWFMRRRFLKIYQNCPYFAPYWTTKEASPFIWTHLNPHHPSMCPTKFG